MKRCPFFIIFLMIIITPSFAANEVSLAYAVGSNLYFRVFDSTGKVWNTSGTPAFETWDDDNVTDYDIALTGTGGSFYQGTFPDLDDGTYSVVSYLRAGGTPAVSDGVISSGLMEWQDSAEYDWGDLYDDIVSLLATLIDLAMPSTQAGRTQR